MSGETTKETRLSADENHDQKRSCRGLSVKVQQRTGTGTRRSSLLAKIALGTRRLFGLNEFYRTLVTTDETLDEIRKSAWLSPMSTKELQIGRLEGVALDRALEVLAPDLAEGISKGSRLRPDKLWFSMSSSHLGTFDEVPATIQIATLKFRGDLPFVIGGEPYFDSIPCANYTKSPRRGARG